MVGISLSPRRLQTCKLYNQEPMIAVMVVAACARRGETAQIPAKSGSETAQYADLKTKKGTPNAPFFQRLKTLGE